jgi:hypothetical protein
VFPHYLSSPPGSTFSGGFVRDGPGVPRAGAVFCATRSGPGMWGRVEKICRNARGSSLGGIFLCTVTTFRRHAAGRSSPRISSGRSLVGICVGIRILFQATRPLPVQGNLPRWSGVEPQP